MRQEPTKTKPETFQIDETCTCGAGFTAQAEGMRSMAVSRNEYRAWKTEHQSCVPDAVWRREMLANIERYIGGKVKAEVLQHFGSTESIRSPGLGGTDLPPVVRDTVGDWGKRDYGTMTLDEYVDSHRGSSALGLVWAQPITKDHRIAAPDSSQRLGDETHWKWTISQTGTIDRVRLMVPGPDSYILHTYLGLEMDRDVEDGDIFEFTLTVNANRSADKVSVHSPASTKIR